MSSGNDSFSWAVATREQKQLSVKVYRFALLTKFDRERYNMKKKNDSPLSEVVYEPI